MWLVVKEENWNLEKVKILQQCQDQVIMTNLRIQMLRLTHLEQSNKKGTIKIQDLEHMKHKLTILRILPENMWLDQKRELLNLEKVIKILQQFQDQANMIKQNKSKWKLIHSVPSNRKDTTKIQGQVLTIKIKSMWGTLAKLILWDQKRECLSLVLVKMSIVCQDLPIMTLQVIRQ